MFLTGKLSWSIKDKFYKGTFYRQQTQIYPCENETCARECGLKIMHDEPYSFQTLVFKALKMRMYDRFFRRRGGGCIHSNGSHFHRIWLKKRKLKAAICSCHLLCAQLSAGSHLLHSHWLRLNIGRLKRGHTSPSFDGL